MTLNDIKAIFWGTPSESNIVVQLHDDSMDVFEYPYSGEMVNILNNFSPRHFEVSVDTLEETKMAKKMEIREAFENEFRFGTLDSSLGFTTDNRRWGSRNDKDNLQSLISLGGDILWTDTSGASHALSSVDAETLKNEMSGAGLQAYQKKWALEASIIEQLTNEDVRDNIQW